MDKVVDLRKIVESSFKIENKNRQRVSLVFNRTQELLYRYILQYKKLLILKFRQPGVSTLILSLITADTLFTDYTHSAAISHEKDATRKLLRKVKFFIDNMEERPKLDIETKDELTFPELHSSFYIGTAGSRAFGRGDTINNLHCSEVAFWPEADTLMDGLTEAVPADGRIFIETTANGAGGRFYDDWGNAKEGLSNYVPLFFPWFIHHEYRLVLLPGEKLEYTAEETELIGRYGLSPEQIKWRRSKRYDLGKKFFQEYPEDDVSCFLQSGRPVFESDDVLRAYKQKDPLFSDGGYTCWAKFDEGWRGRHVVVGVDVSEGLEKGDFSCAEFLDKETGEQLAELHGHWKPEVFAEHLTQILKSSPFPYTLGVERNNHGHVVVLKLKEAGIKVKEWETNAKTKPLMVDEFEEAARKEFIAIHSEGLKGEMFSMQFDAKGSANAPKGRFDDRVMAGAIAWQMRKNNAMIFTRMETGMHIGLPTTKPLPKIETGAPLTQEQIRQAERDMINREERDRMYG